LTELPAEDRREPRSAQDDTYLPLSGWQLAAARVAWATLALGATVLFAAALPARHAQLQTACAAGACASGQVAAATLVPSGAHLPTPVYAGAILGFDLIFAAVYIATALVIFWRRSDDRMALFVSLMLVLWGLTFTGIMKALAQLHPVWFVPTTSVRFLGAALITVFFYVFPDGRFVPYWARWLAGIWVFSQIPKYFWPVSSLNPDRWPFALTFVVSAGFLGVMIALQVYRYRWVSSARRRRQTKWVVLGIVVSLTGYLIVLLVEYVVNPRPGSAGYVVGAALLNASLLLIPIAIAIAILRDQLYDIDLLINRSLVYGILTGVLATLYAASIFLLGWFVRSLTHRQDDSLAIVISTLGVAALFQPLRRRVQFGIERRFYRRRYNAARALEAFGAALHNEVEMATLGEQLVAIIERTMEPAHVSLVLLPPRGAPHVASDAGSSDHLAAALAERALRNDSRNAFGTRRPYDGE
jgi:hypothetical protein